MESKTIEFSFEYSEDVYIYVGCVCFISDERETRVNVKTAYLQKYIKKRN